MAGLMCIQIGQIPRSNIKIWEKSDISFFKD